MSDVVADAMMRFYIELPFAIVTAFIPGGSSLAVQLAGAWSPAACKSPGHTRQRASLATNSPPGTRRWPSAWASGNGVIHGAFEQAFEGVGQGGVGGRGGRFDPSENTRAFDQRFWRNTACFAGDMELLTRAATCVSMGEQGRRSCVMMRTGPTARSSSSRWRRFSRRRAGFGIYMFGVR